MSAFTLASPNAGTVSIPALNKILGISGVPHATIEKVHIHIIVKYLLTNFKKSYSFIFENFRS